MGVINNITGSFCYVQKLENARAYAEGQSFIISAAIYDSSWIIAVFFFCELGNLNIIETSYSIFGAKSDMNV